LYNFILLDIENEDKIFKPILSRSIIMTIFSIIEDDINYKLIKFKITKNKKGKKK